jgi:hypothetical protein
MPYNDKAVYHRISAQVPVQRSDYSLASNPPSERAFELLRKNTRRRRRGGGLFLTGLIALALGMIVLGVADYISDFTILG